MMNTSRSNLLNGSNRKIPSVIYYFILFFLWIIFSFNTSNVDFLTYKAIYEVLPFLPSSENLGLEPGIALIMRLFSKTNLSFDIFFMAMGTISIILLNEIIKKYSINKTVSILLYFFFPFFLDITQFRNTLAYFIILLGLPFLIKRKILPYIVLVLFASFFHISALFYLLFLFCFVKNIRNLQWGLLIVSLAAIILRPIIIKLVSFLPMGYKYSIYLNGTSFIVVSMVYIMLVINYFVSIRVSQGNMELNDKFNFMNNNQMDFTELVPILNLIIICSIPLIALDIDFFRIVRNCFLLNYINLSNSIYKGKLMKSTVGYVLITFVILFVFSYFFLYMNQTDSVVLKILQNNSLFN